MRIKLNTAFQLSVNDYIAWATNINKNKKRFLLHKQQNWTNHFRTDIIWHLIMYRKKSCFFRLNQFLKKKMFPTPASERFQWADTTSYVHTAYFGSNRLRSAADPNYSVKPHSMLIDSSNNSKLGPRCDKLLIS